MMRHRVFISCLLLVIGGGFGNFLRYSDRQPERGADFSLFPDEIDDYSGRELVIDRITLDVLQAEETTERLYSDPEGGTCDLFVAYFKSQKFGGSIHSPKHCLPGGGWTILSQTTVPLEIDDGNELDANLLTISYEDQTSVMVYWFVTRAGATPSEYGLKFDMFTSALLLKPTDAAFVRITVPVTNGNVKMATERCLQFARMIQPYIAEALPF